MRTLCVLLAAAALLTVPGAGLAGDSRAPDAGGQAEPRGLAGTQAIQFSVEGFLELSEFQGQMFSYQRFLTDTRAIRVAGGLFLDLDYRGHGRRFPERRADRTRRDCRGGITA